MDDAFQVGPARRDELAPAFRIIFQQVREEERELRIANALDLVSQGLLDAAGIKVARSSGRGVVGAVICAAVPGAGGIVWPAQGIDSPHRPAIEDLLMQEARRWLRAGGAKLAQCLLAPHELALGPILERNGFTRITDLWYMRHRLKSETPAPRERLRYQTYTDCDRDLFHETLLRTYEDTLDCPEVNGVRTIEETISGHRSQGTHDPDLWWLAWSDATPVGVLLLTEMPEWDGQDLIYLGVVKSARGRGWGTELAHRAITAARAAGRRQLTLSVDSRNLAAVNLYRQAGFETHDRRTVYLSLWTENVGQARLSP
jgi:ribosomal protein S18 acetylase RimI-like enzyme